jgi:hypothetical protein
MRHRFILSINWKESNKREVLIFVQKGTNMLQMKHIRCMRTIWWNKNRKTSSDNNQKWTFLFVCIGVFVFEKKPSQND